MERSEIETALENCELFKGLERSAIEKVATVCRMRTYKTGAHLFRQGDFGEHLYVISKGQVFLERSVDLDTKKGKVVIGLLGVGRALGCWSTLLGEPHNLMSSATCQQPTEVVVLTGEALRSMMLENAAFGFRVLEKLCFLLRDRIQGAYGAMEKI
jgi:CRP/FNR family cyclic AMP-dependent transcriptional regulator